MSYDFFNDDAFSAVSMTRYINVMPYVPTFFGEMNLFNDMVDGTTVEQRFTSSQQNGIDSDVAKVTRENGRLMILPTEARGSMPTYNQPDEVKQRAFQVTYIPKNDEILWDQIIGKRIYGMQNSSGMVGQETSAQAVNRCLTKMWKEYLLTWEYHRLGAVKGVILDADGQQVVYDLFREFGVQKKVVTYDTSLSAVCEEIVSHIGDRLGAMMPGGIGCVVGKDFFDKVQDEVELNTAYERYQDGAHLRTSYQNQPYESRMPQGFHYRGVTFYRYRGNLQNQATPAVQSSMIADNKAHAFPTGTDRFFRSNAPGTCEAAVGTLGLPIYIEREARKFKKGIEFHAESCPLFMCNQPEVLVEIDVV